MKCPYCGEENQTGVCKRCKAMIPAPKQPKKPSKEPEETKKKE